MIAETDTATVVTTTNIEAIVSDGICADIACEETADACNTVSTVHTKTFVNINRIAKHCQNNIQEKPFKCAECTEEFNVEANLRLHKAWFHSPIDGKPECPECGKIFSRKASLRSHLFFHQKDENIRCANCEEEFSSYLNYKNHVNCCSKFLSIQTSKSNERWSCSQCKQIFPTSSLFRDHTKLHFQIKCSLKQRFQRKEVDRTGFVHVCEICSKRFKKKSLLIRHIRVHTGEKPFVCEACGKSFTQKNSLIVHKTKHTGEKKHKCKFCDATFTQPGNMRSHIDRVHAPQALLPEDQLFHCPFCPCVFRKIGSLNCHVSRRHVENREHRSANVNIVSKNFGSKQDNNTNSIDKRDLLRKAMENSGVTRFTSYQNIEGIKTIVPLTDSTTGVRQSHIVRRVGRLSFHQCLYCPKEFKKSSDLVRHIRIHTHERPFKCDQCFRSFTVKSTLKVHLRTHTDQRNFKCGTCPKSFVSYQSLKVHKRIHNPTTSISCTECERQFRTFNRLKSHLKTHLKLALSKDYVSQNPIELSLLENIELQKPIHINTENQENTITGTSLLTHKHNKLDSKFRNLENEKRNFSCTYCGKAFKKSSHLKQHIRSHTGEKPFLCSLCSQGFVSNGSLKAHLRTHSGEKPFRCLQCSFQFTTKGSLTRHMTIHSSNRPYMCPYCNKTFKANLNCKKHIKVHKNEIVMEILQRGRETNNNKTTPENSEDSETSPKENDSSLELLVPNNPSNNCVMTSIGGNLSYITVVGTNTESNVCVPIDPVFQMESLDSHLPKEALELQRLCPPLISSSLINENRSQSTSKSYIISTAVRTYSELSYNSTSALPDKQEMDKTLEKTHSNSTIEATQTEIQKVSQTIEFDDNAKNTSENVAKNKKINDCRSCEYCSKSFKKRSDLVRHVRIHTGEKPFSCKLCNKQFTVKSTLDSHVQTHKGERNFKCFVCNSLFATKGSLNVHTRLHTGDRPFKCNVCNLSFRTSGHLKSHSQKHDKLKNSVTKKNMAFDYYVNSGNVVIVEQNSDNLSHLNDASVVPFVLSSNENNLIDSLIPQQPIVQMDSSNLLASLNIQIDSNLMQQLQQNGVILAASAKETNV